MRQMLLPWIGILQTNLVGHLTSKTRHHIWKSYTLKQETIQRVSLALKQEKAMQPLNKLVWMSLENFSMKLQLRNQT